MSDKLLFRSVVTLMTVALLTTTAGAVVIDLVPIGNLNNVDDTTGYGSVAQAYQIGTYEVTNAQYTEFLNAVADTDTYGLYNPSMWSTYGTGIQRSGSSGNYSYSSQAYRQDWPVNYVSWGDAARFANWLHNGQPTGAQNGSTTEDGAYFLNGATSNSALMAITRKSAAMWVIPTEDEWYKAAYHKNDGDTGNYFDYPTGSDWIPSNDLIDPDPGNNANFYQNGYTSGYGYMTTVGEFENSESPYGTFDQGGNLAEWNETAIISSARGWRGGSVTTESDYLAASLRTGNMPTYEGNVAGFRVAYVPEPGSLALLVCGLLTGLVCCRRRPSK